MKRKMLSTLIILSLVIGTLVHPTNLMEVKANNTNSDSTKNSFFSNYQRIWNKKEKFENNFTIMQDDILNASQVNLYVLDDGYNEKISIPSDVNQTFQLKVNHNDMTPEYSVYSGKSAIVSKDGFIQPATSITYWHGNVGTSWSTGDPNEVKKTEYTYGTTIIQVKVGTQTYYVTVNVCDYAKYYADQVIDQYIEDNITSDMTDLEKLKKITAFPAQYDYDPRHCGYITMIIYGGGDCWASTDAILELCEKTGLQAHSRFAATEPGAGSGHRNVAVKIGEKIYIAEAGYNAKAPRYYNIREENTGFYYKLLEDGSAQIVQYDGFDENIVVPEKIDGHTVTEIGEKAFYYGAWYSEHYIKHITLPNTITKISAGAFVACETLEEIEVASKNSFYICKEGILYDKNMTTLVAYPSGKAGDFVVPDGVKCIDAYAFCYTKKVNNIVLPSSVEKIGLGAFGDSNISKIYFNGDQPEVEKYAFSGMKLDAYYLASNNTWDTLKTSLKNASNITWHKWNSNAKQLNQCEISLDKSIYEYDGKEKKPVVTVKDGTNVLLENVDYSLEYENNINSGEATVIVKAIEGKNFEGTVRIPFKIEKAEAKLQFKVNVVQCELLDKNYTNELQKETDGTITYSSSDKNIATVDAKGKVTLKKVGTCEITASASEGKNYKAKKVSYTLKIGEVKKLDQCKISLDKSVYTYDGQEKKPMVVVKDGTKILSKGKDYTLEYENNINSGEAKVVVRAVVGGKYDGLVKIPFKIEKAAAILQFQESVVHCALRDKTYKNELVKQTDGSITYFSSDTNIATVDNQGEITLKKVGTCKIRVIASEGKNYKPAQSEYNLIVEGECNRPVLKSIKVSKKGIFLTWSKENDCSGYCIYRKDGNGKYKKIKTIIGNSTNTWLDSTRISNGTKYTYKIKAYLKCNEQEIYSKDSNEKKIYFLNPVNIISLKRGTSKTVTVKWSKNSKTSGYEIQYSESKSLKNVKKIYINGSSKNNSTIKGIRSSKTYYVRIRGYKKVGNIKYYSVWSNTKTIKIK